MPIQTMGTMIEKIPKNCFHHTLIPLKTGLHYTSKKINMTLTAWKKQP